MSAIRRTEVWLSMRSAFRLTDASRKNSRAGGPPVIARVLVVAVLLSLFAHGGIVRADIIAYDGFDYSVGTLLAGQDGGVGFSGPWFGDSAGRTIEAESLSFGSLLTSGERVHITQDLGTNRALSTSVGTPAARVYFSFLLRPDGPIDPYTSAGLVLWGDALIFIGKPAVGAQREYVVEQAGGFPQVSSGHKAVENVVAFLVVRADFTAGKDILSLYVDPTPGLPEPVEADAVFDIFDVGMITELEVASWGEGMSSSIDEIRVGETFADVTPVPEPRTLTLFAGLLGIYLTTRRRKPSPGRTAASR